MPSTVMDLDVGARYPSYKALVAAVEKFSIETNSVYTVYNSKSIEAENRHRTPEKQLPNCLKYKTIKFACKHYGKLRSRSRGLRPNQSTFKIGCPSFIYASAHTNELVVEKIERHHTHSCDPDLVALYPERRSLSHVKKDDEVSDGSGAPSLKLVREDVLDLLAMGVERRRIRNYVRICTGRIMLTGDLANLAKYVREHPRVVTVERSTQLLEHVKMIESKENIPAPKQLTTREKFSAIKRKVQFPACEIKTEILRDDDPSEHCYSLTHTGPPTKKQLFVEGHLQEQDESINAENSQQYAESHTVLQDGQNLVTAWDENSSLADVVKSILGPNQEGPIIVHVNNYEGVSVVEVADPYKYDGGEGSAHSTEIQEHGEAVSSEVVDTPVTLKARKSSSPIKIIVPSDSTFAHTSESIPSVRKDSTSKGSPAKKFTTSSVVQSKHDMIIDQQEDTRDSNQDGSFDHEDISDDDDLFDGDSATEQSSIIREERNMMAVKTEKLKLQVEHLRNDLEKQELEKEKLRLEIKLLKLQVQEKEETVTNQTEARELRSSKKS